MTQEDGFTFNDLMGRSTSRRAVLKFAGGAAGALGLAGLLAACGGDDDDGDGDETGTTTTSGGTTPTTADSASPEATGAAAGETPSGGSPAAATSPPGGQAPEGQQGGTLRLGFNLQQLLQLDPARISIGRVA
ncbi:MAG TPA: hypothetical protein VEX37_08345, partial [Thermomicrobiales bacterium]|nr:hypothetical protein [Thermomicrobiales bacterium]